MHTHAKSTRRQFLKASSLAAAGLPVFTARSYRRVLGANDRLQAGLIGCGGMGSAHLNALLGLRNEDNVDVAAVCDVYETRALDFQERVRQVGGAAEVFLDHERLLERAGLDYITIATPEHWHAHMALDALDAGLHVYCEKPVTHLIPEAFAVQEKVRETGLKLQVGVQGMSDESYAAAYDAIQAGKLGPVVEAQIDYVRNYPLDQGPWRTDVPDDEPKPEDLNWERWLGPAPSRPWFAPRYYEWRNYRDYSGGIASDLFIHRITRILRACGLAFPNRIVGMGGIYLWDDGRELPDNMEMLVEYGPVPGVTPGMTLHVLGTMANNRGIEHCIRGHTATLVFTETGWDIISQETGEVVETFEKTGDEDIRLHHQNHHAAIREDAPLNCPVELGVAGVVAISGANQSWFQKRMLSWSPAKRNWT